VPARELQLWYVEHPGALEWPADAELSPETTRLRRALIQDDPPGSRARAQERARELVPVRSHLSREWWRFESATVLDCLLMTDKLVVTVTGTRVEPLGAATPWYPARSRLVRDLEAARQLASGRRWASVLISEDPAPDGTPEALERALALAAPHLDRAARDELRAAYLGNLTWREACAAVDLRFDTLPDTTAALSTGALPSRPSCKSSRG